MITEQCNVLLNIISTKGLKKSLKIKIPCKLDRYELLNLYIYKILHEHKILDKYCTNLYPNLVFIDGIDINLYNKISLTSTSKIDIILIKYGG